jgi:hypothetical protein
MYSELFETIIRTSGENTDDVNSPEPYNFWAENKLFERILKEAYLQEMAYFSIKAFARIFASTLEKRISERNANNLADESLIREILRYLKDVNHSVQSPFAIKDENKILMSFFFFYLNCLRNAFPNMEARLATDVEIKDWAKKMVQQSKNDLKIPIYGQNHSITEIATSDEIIIDTFFELYSGLSPAT